MNEKKQSPINFENLGWRSFFQQQITLEELEHCQFGRVLEHHRSQLEVATSQQLLTLPILSSTPAVCVGDWLLLDGESKLLRRLDRQSCFARKAPGSKREEQLIAANIDTAIIVCALNEDFNLNRIERYLAMINESGAEAIVVLTKTDLCKDVEDLTAKVQSLGSLLPVFAVNTLQESTRTKLLPWCQSGQTLVLLGSSGAGKSTLTNTLLENSRQATAGIRQGDGKGRHTTTARSLSVMTTGALILDTPGMRELQLLASQEGLSATFPEIELLAQSCRFKDCQHESEPGCAVVKALAAHELEPRRLQSYQKLMREQAINAASVAQRRANDRALGKYYKRVIGSSVKNKRGGD